MKVFLICSGFIITLMMDVIAQEKPLQFKNVGPSRGGRVTAVEGVDINTSIYYMGASGGGLWKTEDYGRHWKNISDGFFESPSIGAIAVYQPDPDIIYVGTGSDAIRSNVIIGKGFYKSTDAGKTWSFAGLKDAGQIGAIEIHPADPNIVYVAVIGQPFRKSEQRGVFKSQDGGLSWQKVLFLSDSVGAVDLALAPDNPDLIYAAMWRGERKPWTIISGDTTGGVFKSSDAGASWAKVSDGLPKGLIGKIDFAVSPDMPERVWAQIQAPQNQEGIYRSDDYGENWQRITLPDSIHQSIMYRPFYFTNIDVNPQNADNIWAGTKDFWTSYDGGTSWKKIEAAHADHHDLWINPIDTSFMIAGNDGGGSVSIDGGDNWSTQFNQPTAELYTCDTDDLYPYYLYSGQQDNSTIRIPSSRPSLDVLNSNDYHDLNEIVFWEDAGGCETGPAIPKPGNSEIIYTNCKGQFRIFNRKAGIEQSYYIGAESLYGNHPDDITYRFQRVTPMEVSPHNPDKVYYGSQFLHQTINGGTTWEKVSPDLTSYDPQYRIRSGGPIDEDISGEEYYAVLYAIQESPKKEGVIWTGSNDGFFNLTRDGGKTWTNVTPEMPDGGRISNIEASPHDAAKAYYAVYRDYLGDDKPYLYKTEDYGITWKNIADQDLFSIDNPVRVVREDPNREGLLFAGTEFGLFISFDDGESWKPFQYNLPVTPITDIQIKRNDLVLSTLGRSFWIIEDISVLRQYQENTALNNILFKPKFSPRATGKDDLNIYFALGKNVSDSILTFSFKHDGKVVHQKSISLNELPANDLGIRKTNWDLRHYLPRYKKNDFRGPRVAPGTYMVVLTIGSESLDQTFEYPLHPNLAEIGTTTDHLEEQEDLAIETAKLLIQVDSLVDSLDQTIAAAKNKQRKMALQQQLDYLKKGPRRYDQPKLLEHIKYLYEMISDNPQKPGEDAYQRLTELKKQFIAFVR